MTRGDGQRDAWYEVAADFGKALLEFLSKPVVIVTVALIGLYVWQGPEAVEFLSDVAKGLVEAVRGN